MKKIIFSVIIFILIGGGFFYWWQGHADERELNKTLPKGIRVDKCLLSGEYRVVNKIDGYEFKIPPEWKGIKEIEYIPKTAEEQYDVASINIKGLEGEARFIAIDQFRVKEDLTLENWAKKIFDDYELLGDFTQDVVEGIDTVKTQENIHLAGMYVYFFKKDSKVYALTCGSEEFIHYIITNGKW